MHCRDVKAIMKTYLILLIIATVTFASCKKDKNKSQDGNPVGTWELRHVNGVQVPGAPSDFKPGNGEIVQINQTNFKQISDGKVVNDYKYSIVKKETTVNFDKVSYQLVFDTDKPALSPYFKISDDGKLTLYFGSIAADGFESTYVKQ
ncbi:MAG: hypothetical protein JWR38_4839 [Mucilaginibacter sp.]|nr:hypothetical protein [Mucilaginibacter sp.]